MLKILVGVYLAVPTYYYTICACKSLTSGDKLTGIPIQYTTPLIHFSYLDHQAISK